MAEIPKSAFTVRIFEGMASNYDSADINPGVAEVQINVNGFSKGKLEVRRGLRELSFEDAD